MQGLAKLLVIEDDAQAQTNLASILFDKKNKATKQLGGVILSQGYFF